VAYAAANIASAIPLTPGGLGVIEVTLVAVTTGFGAPRSTAVLAVLGYRIVNYWLPLVPGAIAYIRLRLRSGRPQQDKACERAGQMTSANLPHSGMDHATGQAEGLHLAPIRQ
jgi:hypothetical protein